MPSFFGAAQDLAKGVKWAADTTAWAGHFASRQIRSARDGVCLVCNNLQPYNHEDTFGRAGAAWHHFEESHLATRRKEVGSAAATLVLKERSTKALLECREIDPRTNLPKNNCKYCRLLCEIFDAFFIDEWMSWVTETKNAMPIKFGLMIREGSPLIINCWNFTYDKWFQNSRVDLELYLEQSLFTTPVPGAPVTGPVGPRMPDSRSEFCMQFLQESFQQCCREHPGCAVRPEGFVPTRLIYVGGGNDALQLQDSIPQGETIAWAALSHCWGGGKPMSLVKSNLDKLHQNIAFTDLPPTFQNAITITQQLGLHYVWIDSLCIVQDDRADWEQEAARMGTVYNRAFIVISGASSANPETPYLGPRDPDWLPKRFEFQPSPGVNLPILVRKRSLLAAPLEQGLYEPPFTESWAGLKRVGPLHSRGWCFQESFLAKRIVHFSPGAVIFECQTHRRSEDQLPPYPSTVPGTLGEISSAEQWYMIVKTYTTRQLTYASDKLPAIAGAATQMPQAKSSVYLAGLWSETLLLDLLWQVMPGRAHAELSYKKEEQSSPTWSWASINWGITWNILESPQLLASVVHAETSVPGKNPYGEVSGGHITLRGRIKTCQLSVDYHKNEHWVSYKKADGTSSKKQHFRTDGRLMAEPLPGGTFARRATPGITSSPPNSETWAVFFCIARTSRMRYNDVGLILGISRDFPGSMERVGSITNVPRDWYDTGEEKTLTIV